MEQFLDSAFAPLAVEGSQVGALFWSVGEHQVRWEATGSLEQVGSYTGRKYRSASDLTHTENVLAMLARGEVKAINPTTRLSPDAGPDRCWVGRWQDPHAALIERGHAHGMHVYASLRMNDQHLEPNPLASTGMTKLRARND